MTHEETLIDKWTGLKIVKYAKRKTALTFSGSDNGFHVIRFDANPIIKFSIEITLDLKISCYKKSSKITVKEL